MKLKLSKEELLFYKNCHDGHDGPNGEKVGDYIICMNYTKTKDFVFQVS